MTSGLVTAIIGLIVVITVHIVVIARWSGRIDGYLASNSERMAAMDSEIHRLRDARHLSDGEIQRQKGVLRELQHSLDRRAPQENE